MPRSFVAFAAVACALSALPASALTLQSSGVERIGTYNCSRNTCIAGSDRDASGSATLRLQRSPGDNALNSIHLSLSAYAAQLLPVAFEYSPTRVTLGLTVRDLQGGLVDERTEVASTRDGSPGRLFWSWDTYGGMPPGLSGLEISFSWQIEAGWYAALSSDPSCNNFGCLATTQAVARGVTLDIITPVKFAGAVPEASTSLLVASGLGFLGVAARRRAAPRGGVRRAGERGVA